MDYQVLSQRIGSQIREMRRNRGLKQADLARISGVTRQKLIEIEKGSTSVAMNAYARVLGTLGCEVKLVPAALPTLDEVQDLFN